MRYRKISCSIWNDDKFPFASDDCQIVIFHLLSTPLSTPFGLYKASVAALAEEKRWTKGRYASALNEAIKTDFVKYDAKHHVIYIPNFLRYNPPHNPNVLRSWSEPFKEIPSSSLKDEFFQALVARIESYSEAFREAFSKAFRHHYRNNPVPVPVTGTEEVFKEDKILYLNEFSDVFQVSDNFSAAWTEWIAHRKDIKKPLTERSAKMQAKRLSELSITEAVATIEKSIECGWTGLFSKEKVVQKLSAAGQAAAAACEKVFGGDDA